MFHSLYFLSLWTGPILVLMFTQKTYQMLGKRAIIDKSKTKQTTTQNIQTKQPHSKTFTTETARVKLKKNKKKHYNQKSLTTLFKILLKRVNLRASQIRVCFRMPWVLLLCLFTQWPNSTVVGLLVSRAKVSTPSSVRQSRRWHSAVRLVVIAVL